MPTLERSAALPDPLAAARQALSCALQPIVDARTGVLNGVEALMRGHGTLGFASPNELLDHYAAEGLIAPLETLLHAKALAAFQARAPGAAEGAVRLFLNLDGRALVAADGSVPDQIGRLMVDVGLPRATLCIELSERSERLLAERVQENVRRLKDTGIRFAADDFGQGQSEIRLLFDGVVDFIKIDRYFIQGVARNERQKIVVSSLTRFAHLLGVRVIAQGVETSDDLAACRNLGCDLVQGWFVAPPEASETPLPASFAHVAAAASRAQDGRTREGGRSGLIGATMRPLPAVPDSERMEAVLEFFLEHIETDVCVIVDAAGEPRGVVTQSALRRFAYSRYGRDLLNREMYRTSLGRFIEPCPSVEADKTIAEVLDVFLAHPGARAVIVTDGGRYAGLLLGDALVALANERYLAEALDRNPLTRLPGNSVVAAQINQAIAADAARLGVRHICYFDFDHFKPFNDLKGFRRGDRVIVLFAEALQRRVRTRSDAFFGHLGGDDFVGVFSGIAPGDLRDLLAEALGEFAGTVAGFYTAEERAQGWVEGLDRYGANRRFPLLRCSVAVLEIPAAAVVADPAEVDARLVQLKAAAKSSQSGIAWGRLGGAA